MVKKKVLKKILITSSSYKTIDAFLLNFIKNLSLNFNVCVATSLNNLKRKEINYIEEKYNFKLVNIPIKRNINIFFDIYALIKLLFIIRQREFDITLSLTPKAGLLTSLSSLLNGIKNRIHIFNGQIWYNKKGFYRKFLKFFDLITFHFSNRILCESFSQASFLKEEGFTQKEIKVLGYGSLMGVDTQLFKFDMYKRKILRRELSLRNSDKVCMFIGRINYEKGLNLIIRASDYFAKKNNIFFILIGESEIDPIELINIFAERKNIIYLGTKKNINEYLSASEFTVLPSSREGFGISVIEAASVKRPSLISDIDGLKDTIEVNKSGYSFISGNQRDFNIKLKKMFSNSNLTKKMGFKARRIIEKKYEKNYVISNYVKYIQEISQCT